MGHDRGACLYGVPRVTRDQYRVTDSSGHCWQVRIRFLAMSAMDVFTAI